MDSRGRLELAAATALFIGASSVLSLSRGHPRDSVFIVLVAPALAALVTLVAGITRA